MLLGHTEGEISYIGQQIRAAFGRVPAGQNLVISFALSQGRRRLLSPRTLPYQTLRGIINYNYIFSKTYIFLVSRFIWDYDDILIISLWGGEGGTQEEHICSLRICAFFLG